MKNIYIGGDSFCWDRRTVESWPVFLANKLNLNLCGTGFAGRGFWNTRLDLIEYLNNKDIADNTDLFIFCHTSPDRTFSATYGKYLTQEGMNPPTPTNNKEIVEIYYKYLYDEKIHNWVMEQWFLELNEILANKPVIHLFCFLESKNLSERLNGHKLSTNLYEHSLKSGSEIGDLRPMFNSSFLNHFSKNYNIRFANALVNYYLNEMSANPTQTKYFDIHV